MVPAKASGFLSEQETGDRAARQLWPSPLYCPTLWRAPLLSGIQGKLGANDSCTGFGFPSEPVWRALGRLFSRDVRAFPFGNQSECVCEKGPFRTYEVAS